MLQFRVSTYFFDGLSEDASHPLSRGVAVTQFILAFALLCSSAGFAEDPFVGHWKIDAARGRLTGSIFFTMKADGTPQVHALWRHRHESGPCENGAVCEYEIIPVFI